MISAEILSKNDLPAGVITLPPTTFQHILHLLIGVVHFLR